MSGVGRSFLKDPSRYCGEAKMRVLRALVGSLPIAVSGLLYIVYAATLVAVAPIKKFRRFILSQLRYWVLRKQGFSLLGGVANLVLNDCPTDC
jgi:hypothetical protein